MREVLSLEADSSFIQTALAEDATQQQSVGSRAPEESGSRLSSLEGFTDKEVQAAVLELEIIGQIVAEHAATVIVCERLGGAEMTLGDAVMAIWPPPSREL